MNESLGHLVWFSIHSSSRMVLTDIHGAFTRLGLDSTKLPKAILPIYAFQTASANTKVTYTDDVSGENVELKAREVKTTADFHERHVLRHAEKPNTGLGSSAKLIQLKFIHAHRKVTGRHPTGHRLRTEIVSRLDEPSSLGTASYPVTEQDATMAQLWLDQFTAEYEQLQTELHPDKLRAAIRDVLLGCNSHMVTRAGLYLVDPEHACIVEALQEFISLIPGDCKFNAISISPTPENHHVVQQILEAQ